MKKIINHLLIEDYRRNMDKKEKFWRDTKIAAWLLVALFIAICNMIPLYAVTVVHSKKFEIQEEWICPNRYCRYDNYDGIRYCGLCGTERGSRKR